MNTYLNARARINGTKIGDQFCVYTNDERTSFAVESDREHPRAFPVKVYSDNNNRRFLKESSEIIDVLKATGILQGTHEEPAFVTRTVDARDASPREWEPPTSLGTISTSTGTIGPTTMAKPQPAPRKPDSTPAKRGEPQPKPVPKKK